ncbi:MAG: hypothetical protein E7580_05980 [Ruminococcaceae bacterium]|nr:hypothetical protein [Oscillospiraceae bacterium]
MGLLGDIILSALMNSSSKAGDVTRKSFNYLSENDRARKNRVLMDAQRKAHNQGNKELEERIKAERKKYK